MLRKEGEGVGVVGEVVGGGGGGGSLMDFASTSS